MSQPRADLERWPVRGRYGDAEALESMGTIAAPLLAGFSLTISTVVLTSSLPIRWPGVTLLFATLAAVALVGSVQFTFWARLWAVTPDDMRTWWDDADKPDGRHELIIEMKQFGQVYRAYSARARSTYNVGITSLLLAFAVGLAPPAGVAQPALRWVSAALAASAAVAEVMWTLLSREKVRESPRLPKPLQRLGQWLVLSPTSKRFTA